jgi:hypothetical protein
MISENVLQCYTYLYLKQFSCRPKMDGLTFNSVDDDEALWLERTFEESEVLDVVKALNGDKALDNNEIICFPLKT